MAQALVHAGAHALGKFPVVEGTGVGARGNGHVVHRLVYFIGRDAWAHERARMLQHPGSQLAGLPHSGNALCFWGGGGGGDMQVGCAWGLL